MRKLIAALLGAAAIAGPAFAQEQEMRPADSPEPGRVWRERAPASTPPVAEQREFRAERREAQREFRQDRREARQEFRQERGEARQEFRQDRQEDVRDPRQERRQDQLERLRDRAQVGQDRQEWRSDRRDRDWNDGRRDRDWNDGRRDREWNDGRRDRDWNDGRRDRDWNDGRRGDWNDGRQFGDWNRGWRQDRRYNWQDWRQRNRGVYRLPPYSAPRGWGFGYRRYTPGIVIAPSLFARNYWILDPWEYRLPPAYGPYRWVRYWDDVLLVDLRTGRVVDVIPDFFW